MKSLMVSIACIVSFAIVLFFIPKYSIAKPVNSDLDSQITLHTPKMIATKEEKIPVKRTWLWVLLAVVLAGGAAAAVAGGGGGDKGGGGSDTGSVTVNW